MFHREKFNRPGDSEGFVERPAHIGIDYASTEERILDHMVADGVISQSTRLHLDEITAALQSNEVLVVEPDYKLLSELFPSLYADAQREAERMKVKP